MRNTLNTPTANCKAIKSPLKSNFRPLIISVIGLIGVSSLGLLSGCSQLQTTDDQTDSSAYATSTNLKSSAFNKTYKNTRILGLDSKAEIHQRAITEPKRLVERQTANVLYKDVWDEIASNLTLGDAHFNEFARYNDLYIKKPKYLAQVSKRAQPYMHYIFSEVKQRNMPYEMALLPIIESGFQATAKSTQHALGLWQFIPQTGDLYGLERNWWYEGRQDVVQSTEAALTYLKKLHDLNNDDWLLALASYNGGIGNVWRAIKKYQTKHPEVEKPSFWQIRSYLPKETQHYVPQLLAVAHTLQNREQLNLEIEPIENRAYFKIFEFDKQIALDKVAALSGTSDELFAQLNPGYLRPSTPPSGPHTIVLPIKHSKQFQKHLAANSAIFNVQTARHQVRKGDTLGEIAQKNNTTSAAIQKLNNMRNTTIAVGKTLLIPTSGGYDDAAAPTEKPVNNGPKTYHTVKAGESLWSIAAKYNTDSKTLSDWNKISAHAPILKGQKLAIHSSQQGYKSSYTLKSGDNLSMIAKRFDVTTADLTSWNNLKFNQTLQPGMQLTLWLPNKPVTNVAQNSAVLLQSKKFKRYTVKSGDSLWDIALANKVSTKIIASYNQISEKGFLKPGQVLKIPYAQNT